MPLSSNRPQTLRQAKKAYRKSGATVRLSASELAVIERRAVLQERADRIKEREGRRKVNLRRKEERNQKEREERSRMGIPSPEKGIKVGPSQSYLGDFMTVGKRRMGDHAIGKGLEMEKDDRKELIAEMRTSDSHMSPRPWRNPLEIVSPNVGSQSRMSRIGSKSQTSQSSERCLPSKADSTICSRPSGKSTNVPTAPKPPPDAVEAPNHAKNPISISSPNNAPVSAVALPDSRRQAMPHPPLPKITKPERAAPPPSRKTLRAPTQSKQPSPPEDDWDDLFVSNTQITRELSPPPRPRASPPNATKMPPLTNSLPFGPHSSNHQVLANDLLSLICTQDLDFCGILTQAQPTHAPIENEDTQGLLEQLSTQDLDLSDMLSQAAASSEDEAFAKGDGESSYFSSDLNKADLEDLVLEHEHDADRKSESADLSKEVCRFDGGGCPPSSTEPEPERLNEDQLDVIGMLEEMISGSDGVLSKLGEDGDIAVDDDFGGTETEVDEVGRGLAPCWDDFGLSTQDVKELTS
ncbi:hypothetical protein MMC21_000682 [Puttea exsequens]|nr:hypothetical protein [Puttea exsequens]